MTMQELQKLVDYLNDITNNEMDFSIGCAYGGFRLESHGGSRDILTRTTKHGTANLMRALIKGIQISEELHRDA